MKNRGSNSAIVYVGFEAGSLIWFKGQSVAVGQSLLGERTNVARVCMERGMTPPVATIGLVLKGSAVSPVQLRRATLYPAELAAILTIAHAAPGRVLVASLVFY
jgi:hypothetical protein